MDLTQLKYLNALNLLISAKINALQKIAAAFNGNFERAWHASGLKAFLPSDAPGKTSVDPEKEWQKLQKENIEIVTHFDPAFPELLRHITDPPFLLYVKGNKKALEGNCFAVVGTRALTEYGRRVVPLIVEPLAKAGLTIVSGLAMGIDGLAHQAAVKMDKPTIAVLGAGLSNDAIVLQNRKLAKEILQKNGAIITEYPLGVSGSLYSFLSRISLQPRFSAHRLQLKGSAPILRD